MKIEQSKFNVIFLGETEVGKTSIIKKYKENIFQTSMLSTAGIDYIIDESQFDGKIYKFKIFDTAGQERFKSIAGNTIKVAHGFFVVFSLTNIKSFYQVKYWITTIKENSPNKNIPIILIGNKCDLKKEVQDELINEYKNNKGIKYFETSALTGKNIHKIFTELYTEIYNIQKNKKGAEKEEVFSIEDKKVNKPKGKKC